VAVVEVVTICSQQVQDLLELVVISLIRVEDASLEQQHRLAFRERCLNSVVLALLVRKVQVVVDVLMLSQEPCFC
jgi:hypothetical protein